MVNGQDGSKKTVVVADDEDDLRGLLSQLLTTQGWEVLAAANGVEALEHTKAKFPDIIITDVNMPEMGGIELYKSILSDDGKPKCPVLFLATSGELSEHFPEKVEGVDFMGKPFQLNEIMERINSLVS